ncbi:MAG: FmdE family protein [Methanoregula sp.]|nr:FmdE family protein [Methanoregula sp.]
MTDGIPDNRDREPPLPDLDLLLRKATEFHGEFCAGIVLGTRMTVIGMRELGMNPLKKNLGLIVYVETDRCITDAIQAITGCSLGRRTLKFWPYGKFAATYVDRFTGIAVRVNVLEKKRTEKTDKEAMKDAARILLETPESDLFRIRRVNLTIPEGDMPGMPKFRARCSRCNEMIVDNKEVACEGDVLCGNCAGVPYYTDME